MSIGGQRAFEYSAWLGLSIRVKVEAHQGSIEDLPDVSAVSVLELS